MNVNFVPNFSKEDTNDAFGEIILHGRDIERYIISEVVLWSGAITKKIFAANFYKKEKQFFKSYWRKDTHACIPFVQIRGGSYEPVPKICSDWVVGVIHDFLKRNNNAVVLFEDVMFNPSDDITKKSGLSYFEYMEKLYHFITPNNSKNIVDDIENALNLIGLGFNDTIILTQYKNIEKIDSLKKEKSFEQDKIVDVLVNNAEIIFFTAYDHQGYIMWKLNE